MMFFVVRKSIAESLLKSIQGDQLAKGGFGIGTVRVWRGKRYKKAENGKWVRLYENKAADIKHDGEFVLSSKGSKDFGEITPEISKNINRQAGKIRFTKGYQNPNDERDGFGEEHFNRTKRIRQLKAVGYENSRDFVEDVSKNFTKIYQGRGASLILLKEGDKNSLEYIELTPSDDEDYWQVTSGHPVRPDSFKNKKPLWSKSNNGIQTSEQERAQSNQSKKSPSAISGNSDNSNIARSFDSVKKKDINKSFIMKVREILNRKEA